MEMTRSKVGNDFRAIALENRYCIPELAGWEEKKYEKRTCRRCLFQKL
jgi:hypothetical protein